MIRRRHSDSPSDLEEPLLGDADRDEDKLHLMKSPLNSPTSQAEMDSAASAWHHVLAGFLLNWAGWLSRIMSGSRDMLSAVQSSLANLALIQRRIGSQAAVKPVLPPVVLSPIQAERMTDLRRRVEHEWKKESDEDQAELQALWNAVYPGRPMSEENEVEGWKDMGWQGNHPATDFRGGGLLALQNVIYYAKTYPESFRRIMLKQEGRRAEWEYPFAAAGVNLTVLLSEIMGLRSGVPDTLAGRALVRLLEEDEHAFEEVYCVLFEMLDAKWLEMRASYMEFNVVLKATRAALERILSDSTLTSIKNIPQHKLLTRDA